MHYFKTSFNGIIYYIAQFQIKFYPIVPKRFNSVPAGKLLIKQIVGQHPPILDSQNYGEIKRKVANYFIK